MKDEQEGRGRIVEKMDGKQKKTNKWALLTKNLTVSVSGDNFEGL